MSRGYVYVLSNPSMPGLVKIGRTTRSVDQRASELWQTGVPTPFVVEYFQLFPDCIAAEAEVHETFCDQRESDCREFFRVSVEEVISAVKDQIFWSLQEIVAIYHSDFRVLNYEDSSAFAVVERCSERIGVSPVMVALGACERPDETVWSDVERIQRKVAVNMSAEDAA